MVNISDPLVSIITPVYNHEKYISDCINSVISQTFSSWEQIIIDDGSTDNSLEIIRSFSDKRIRVIHQRNKGIENLYQTYNKALKIARGKYIAILEGDDYWPIDKLEKQISIFEQNKNIVLVWGKAVWVDEQKRFITTAPFNINKYTKSSNIPLLRDLLLSNFIPAVTVMIRRESLLSINGFIQRPYLLMVDYPTWLSLLLTGQFVAINYVLGYWRRHESQMSTKRQHQILLGAAKFAIEFYRELPIHIKKELNLSEEKIRNYWRFSMGISSFIEGRKFLVNKQWSRARDEFLFALKMGNNFTKLKAVLGLIASYFHFNLEAFARLRIQKMRKDSYLF